MGASFQQRESVGNLDYLVGHSNYLPAVQLQVKTPCNGTATVTNF